MKRRNFGIPYFLSLVFFCVGVALSTSKHLSSRAGPAGVQPTAIQSGPEVVNKTSALQVVTLQKTGTDVQLTLKNGYQGNITAFAISPGSYSIRSDLAFNGYVIAPGDSYTQRFTLPNPQVLADGSVLQPVITILSVIFEDGSSDGERQVAHEIMDTRLGHKEQMASILAQLLKISDSSDDDLPEAVNRARTNLTNLPVKIERGTSLHPGSVDDSARERAQAEASFYHEFGRHNARAEALLDLERLDQERRRRGNSFRQQLLNLIGTYSKRQSRL